MTIQPGLPRYDGPFDLLFTDSGYDKSDPGPILALVERGGLIVMDDLTPEQAWSESLRAKYPDGDRSGCAGRTRTRSRAS